MKENDTYLKKFMEEKQQMRAWSDFSVWQRDEQVMPMSICGVHAGMLGFMLHVLLLSWLTAMWISALLGFFRCHVS